MRKVPSDTILKQYEGYVKGNTPQRLFSVDDYDGANTDTNGDSGTKFKDWTSAFMHFENTPNSNLAFAEAPGPFADEMEFGLLDANGKWSETLGVYSKDSEGLAAFNEDVKDFLSAYEMSDEELNDLFPADDDYAEDYSVGEWDVPPSPGTKNLEGDWEVQNNREGFTRTDTKSFKKWFNDDSGELTNRDGKPKVFMRGSMGEGRTNFGNYKDKKSGGLFFTESPRVAVNYGEGASVDINDNYTLMDGLKGWGNDASAEWKPRYLKGWGPAKDYLRSLFQDADGNGLRLVGMDADGNVVDKLAKTDHFSLQTNMATAEQLENEDMVLADEWRELASYPKTRDSLEQFNQELGGYISQNRLGLRGYSKVYLSAKKT